MRERELAETSQELQGVIDTVPAAVFMKDTDGQYLLMNKYAREIAGLDLETSVTGKTDYDLFPDEVATEFQEEDEHVRNSGKSIKYVEKVPISDGFKTHLTIKRPVFEENRDLYGICAVAMDVSEFESINQTEPGKRKPESRRT